MSLPARQQRMLNGIEGALRASEPHMASMFAIFTRLAENDRTALPERLPRSRLRMRAGLRPFVLLPVVFAMLITGILLSGTARGSSCGGARVSGFALHGVGNGVGSAAHVSSACTRSLRPTANVSSVRP